MSDPPERAFPATVTRFLFGHVKTLPRDEAPGGAGGFI
jgi:hypothetical protein